MKIYKASEWQIGNSYYVNDVQDSDPKKWYIPLNILGISAVEYAKMLKDKFKVKSMSYSAEYDVLIFSFASIDDARKYKNFINAEARKKQFYV